MHNQNQTVTIAPTGDDRIHSMDITRGIALLGILLMNITGLGLSHAYSYPGLSGGTTGWNLKVWWIDSMFFEGTMRGLFSILFGAGIYIFTSRNLGNDSRVTNLYIKRLLWLFLFGIIHAYLLLWDGDILYPYALVGFFAYTFRNWKSKYLIIGAVFLLVCSTALSLKDYLKTKIAYDKAQVAEVKKSKGEVLTKKDSNAIGAWDGIVKERNPTQEKIDEDIAERNKGYMQVVWYKATINQMMQSFVMYRYYFWDIFAMILIGMAFFKNGILKAERSNKFYLTFSILGYVIGLSVNYWETTYVIDEKFSIMSQSLTEITYDIGRVFVTFGHIGLIMLFVKSGVLKFIRNSLASVGRMAFSNYIMQTIICNTIFLGIGFGLYGKLQRYQLYYVVAGVWLFQSILSPIWLRYFRFGPLEWCWRSLTYWKKQPFRRS